MSRLNLSLKYDHLKYVWYAGLPSAEKLFEVSAHPAVAGPEEGPGGPAPISRCGSGTARVVCVNGKHPFNFWPITKREKSELQNQLNQERYFILGVNFIFPCVKFIITKCETKT